MSANAGQILAGPGGGSVPFVVGGTTIGSVIIDAATTLDPRNGGGSVFFEVTGGPGIDIRTVVWSIIARGPQGGRIDS